MSFFNQTFDLALFLSTFGLIFVAELPDKTAFATVLMATNQKAWPVFLGASLAFLVQTIVAVAFGSLFGLLPAVWVHRAAALLFMVFAVQMWRKSSIDEEAEAKKDAKETKAATSIWRATFNAFMVIFIAEWGDLTQLATATLSAKFPTLTLTIFCSSVLALWAVTGVAVVVGSQLGRFINQKILGRVGAVAMAGAGVYMLVGA